MSFTKVISYRGSGQAPPRWLREPRTNPEARREMSIKRSKTATRGKARAGDGTLFGAKNSEPKWNWKEHVSEEPEDAFLSYDMGNTFAKKALIKHSKFGKGLVIAVDGVRIEVLFEDGTKKLAHTAA